MKGIQVFGGLATLFLAATLAAQGPARFPVIVVMEDNISYSGLEREFQQDDRMRADPPAWGYLNRGVVGAVSSFGAASGIPVRLCVQPQHQRLRREVDCRPGAATGADSIVKYVEPDGAMFASARDVVAAAQVIPWGITRIGAYKAGRAAVGVNVYVIDTGIDKSHPDLNIVGHVNFAGGKNEDCNGHGTHVSGTIAAKDNAIDVVGVAPGAPLTGVKVLGCSGSGSTSGVIKGVDWVTANRSLPAVANMSPAAVSPRLWTPQ